MLQIGDQDAARDLPVDAPPSAANPERPADDRRLAAEHVPGARTGQRLRPAQRLKGGKYCQSGPLIAFGGTVGAAVRQDHWNPGRVSGPQIVEHCPAKVVVKLVPGIALARVDDSVYVQFMYTP